MAERASERSTSSPIHAPRFARTTGPSLGYATRRGAIPRAELRCSRARPRKVVPCLGPRRAFLPKEDRTLAVRMLAKKVETPERSWRAADPASRPRGQHDVPLSGSARSSWPGCERGDVTSRWRRQNPGLRKMSVEGREPRGWVGLGRLGVGSLSSPRCREGESSAPRIGVDSRSDGGEVLAELAADAGMEALIWRPRRKRNSAPKKIDAMTKIVAVAAMFRLRSCWRRLATGASGGVGGEGGANQRTFRARRSPVVCPW